MGFLLLLKSSQQLIRQRRLVSVQFSSGLFLFQICPLVFSLFTPGQNGDLEEKEAQHLSGIVEETAAMDVCRPDDSIVTLIKTRGSILSDFEGLTGRDSSSEWKALRRWSGGERCFTHIFCVIWLTLCPSSSSSFFVVLTLPSSPSLFLFSLHPSLPAQQASSLFYSCFLRFILFSIGSFCLFVPFLCSFLLSTKILKCNNND